MLPMHGSPWFQLYDADDGHVTFLLIGRDHTIAVSVWRQSSCDLASLAASMTLEPMTVDLETSNQKEENGSSEGGLDGRRPSRRIIAVLGPQCGGGYENAYNGSRGQIS
jgi:hypothetical protein